MHAPTDKPIPLPVIFRAEVSGDDRGEITAVFPTVSASYSGDEFTIYAHLGQHSGAGFDWYRRTRAARPHEYGPLLRELQRIYETRRCPDDHIFALQVRQRYTRAHRREMQADARASRDALRKDPSGAPWSPDARDAASEAIAPNAA